MPAIYFLSELAGSFSSKYFMPDGTFFCFGVIYIAKAKMS
jgi:hypothetical protein